MIGKKFIAVAMMAVLLLVSASGTRSQIRKVTQQVWKGVASYYHKKFNGRKTSTGEVFQNTKFTCANNFLALGTLVKITNPRNGKSVVVKVNDRMHPRNKRLVDLSQAAAEHIGLLKQGVGEVHMELLHQYGDIAGN